MERKIVGFLAAEAPRAGSREVFCIGHRGVKPIWRVEIVEPIRSGGKIAAVLLDMLDADRADRDRSAISVGDCITEDDHCLGDPFMVVTQSAVGEVTMCGFRGVEPGMDGVVILPAAAVDARG